MSDHNILNSATFDDKQLRHEVVVQPFIRENNNILPLGGENVVFWVKRITWSFKYRDVGLPNATQIARNKIIVSVGDIIENAEDPYPAFIQPKPIQAEIPFKVINTNQENNHQLRVTFYLDGVLVKPRPGAESLPLKKMLAFIMMDSTDRGKYALDEAATDQLEATFAELGLGSLRESIPGGLSALKSLPPALQNHVIAAIAAKNGSSVDLLGGMMPSLGGGTQINPALALPESDPLKEESSFIGDLLAVCPDEIDLSKHTLKTIAGAMIERGWRKV